MSEAAQLRSLDDGLELHWSFENHIGTSVRDLSGNARHGTLHGGSFVSSPMGEAVSLDGVDDYIALTYHEGLRDPALYGGVDGDFTISARVRIADVDKLNTLCFGCGPFSTMFVGTTTGPKVQSGIYNQQTGGLLWPASSATLVADEWREVTMVVDGGTSVRYYLDCQADTELQSPDIGLNNHNFSAVGWGSSADRWYGGEIDRLRIWSRALSEQELTQLCPKPKLTDDLELHWTFEDRDGSEITDVSGNGRHGTLHGGSIVSSPQGEAVSLDGVDDYVSLTHLGLRDPSLYGGVEGDFTISARVRVADAEKLNTLCFGCGPLSSMFVGTAHLGPTIQSALFNQQTGASMWVGSSPTIVDDQWREVTMVVEGGEAARYYLDCQLDTELQDPNIGLKNYNFSAVGLGSSAERWYGGEIDSLRVWSRALSEELLAQLCPEPPPEDDGLQLHWTFEDHDGTKITDVSGHGRHGTLHGGSLVSSPMGEAVSLDGVDDYLALTHLGLRDPSLYGGVDGGFTISARVRVDDSNKLNTLCFGCGPLSSMFVGTTTLGPTVQSALYNQQTGGVSWAGSSAALVDDEWRELTMVVDGGEVARYYLDCQIDTLHASEDIGLKDYNFSAIGLGASAERWYGGEIDELRIWNRALTAQQLCGCDGPIYVNIDAPAGGDGTTWATAFNNLQAAVDAGVACDTPQIWVAEGSYAPDPNEPVATVTAPVEIYGGFTGTETAIEQRDFQAHPVQLGAPGWQSRVVVIISGPIGTDTVVRLDGFTISGSEAGAMQVGGGGVVLDNLVITDNTAVKGAGILAGHNTSFELANSHFEGNVATTAGAAIYMGGTWAYVDNSTFIANESPGAAIHDPWSEFSDWGELQISNSTMSNNVGGAISGDRIIATNTEFSNNTAEHGGAIQTRRFGLEVHGCVFTGNQADYGGAITLSGHYNSLEVHKIYNSSFLGNTAKRGGAISHPGSGWDWYPTDKLVIEGGEFIDNVATEGRGGAIDGGGSVAADGVLFAGNTASGEGGGALYLGSYGLFYIPPEHSVESSTFIGNSAPHGGAIQIAAYSNVDIQTSRFIGNQALVDGGGAIHNLAEGLWVINSEFVGNVAATDGGGVYGRTNLVATTFANNLAGGQGNGLFAPSGGSQMTARNVVAWPDDIVASSVNFDHSCVPQPIGGHTNDGSIWLLADPFAPADLDLDGLTEQYLDPASACVDIGGTVDELDWTTMTTQTSQCTDVTPLDAGVHYTPLSAAGPC